MLRRDKVGLELRVSSREPAHVGEIVLTLEYLVLEPGAEVDDWNIDEVVEQEEAEDAARDLNQQALARFELLIAAAGLSDQRIETLTRLLEVGLQRVAQPFADAIEPFSKHLNFLLQAIGSLLVRIR